jgi:hypothetical protein
MIARLLRRFCSPEVEMMLKHLEEHPEDFEKIVKYSTWQRLADQVAIEGTFAEKRVLTAVARKAFKRLNRQKLLGAIVTQTIAPMSTEAYEDGVMYVGTGVGNPTQIAAQQHVQLHKLYQQQLAMNAAQGISYDGSQRGLGNVYSTATTTPRQP